MQKGSSLIKKWISKNKVIDVIAFGSSARGKKEPRDIDLCILIKDEDEKKSIDLVGSLSKAVPLSHVNIITVSNFIEGSTLAKTLMQEGYSIKNGKNFSSLMGFDNKSLFVYQLKDFTPSKRVRFHYALQGRKSPGILKEVDGKIIGAGTIIVPSSKEDVLKEVFNLWGVKYHIERLLLG